MLLCKATLLSQPTMPRFAVQMTPTAEPEIAEIHQQTLHLPHTPVMNTTCASYQTTVHPYGANTAYTIKQAQQTRVAA
jgi:hypothetical protein